MSIDFGTDIYEEPIVAKTFLSEDAQEGSLRPKTLANTSGRRRPRATSPSSSRRQSGAMSRSTTFCSTALRALAKRRSRASSPPRWASTSASPPAPPSKRRATSRRCSPICSENDILFVDEIHRLNRAVEEILYPAMEDYAIDIIIGKGPSRQLHPAGPAALHAHRRDDPRRSALRAAARPLRRHAAAGAVYARGACADRHALGRHPGRFHRARGRDGDRRAARAARRASPTGCSAACATLPRSGPTASSRARWPTRRSRALEVDQLGLDAIDRRMLRSHHRELRRRPGGPGHARRDHRRGVRHARRTCMSRT